MKKGKNTLGDSLKLPGFDWYRISATCNEIAITVGYQREQAENHPGGNTRVDGIKKMW